MKSILLIGVGGFGKILAKQMGDMGHQILAVDREEERINEILPYVTSAQIGESTSQEFLQTLGVKNFDICFVTVGDDFQSSLETTSLLKDLGAKMVVARAASDIQEKFLLRNGADEVIYPEKQVARWAAVRYTSESIEDYIRLDDDHAIFEVIIPKEWVGKSVTQLDIRRRHQINILAVKRDGEISGVVSPDTILEPDMTMLVLGEYKTMMKLFKK
ncbi:MAG: TrkA family potassium uptake protein [Clostridiales bacterium]|nr:TrkA family potassium uptake protein [Clostridiales bacterium]